MRIGIDATNIGGGGGVTHLKEIIKNYNSKLFNGSIDRIVIFSSQKVLDQIDDKEGVDKVTFSSLNKGLLKRLIFQIRFFDKEIIKRCDILLSVTGDYFGSFRPVIGMSRNMLLYERDIWRQIKKPREILRFWLNFQKQKVCFKRSSGIIFISYYALDFVSKVLSLPRDKVTVIHHGLSPRFKGIVKSQLPSTEYSFENPFRFLYVSTVHVYKNHSNVVKAVGKLRELGYPISIDLIGGIIFKPTGDELLNTIYKIDPKGEFVNYLGHQDYEQIDRKYKLSDGIIFASTCENMPNILIESMASGVPIVSSDKQPMPEFLKKGGFYFDATSVKSIFDALKEFLSKPKERSEKAIENLKEVERFSWEKTSFETFKFITEVYSNPNRG